jgi:hypothetical protein
MINCLTTDIVHLHYMRPHVCYHGEHTQHLAVLAGLIVSEQIGMLLGVIQMASLERTLMPSLGQISTIV